MKKWNTRLVSLLVLLALLPFAALPALAADGPFRVGETYYGTLEEAAAAVSAGGVITLARDAMLAERDGWVCLSEDKAYTFDLDGKTLTAGTYYSSALYIDAGEVTIRNGSIVSLSDTSAILVDGGSVILGELSVRTGGRTFQKAVSVSAGFLSILSGEYIGGEDAVFCGGGEAVIAAGHFVAEYDGLGDGCLVTDGGAITLAPGSKADPLNWLNGADEVTVTAANTEDGGCEKHHHHGAFFGRVLCFLREAWQFLQRLVCGIPIPA